MSFITLSAAEQRELTGLDQFGYVFDWTRRSSTSSLVVSSVHDGDMAGLVEFERRPADRYDYLWLIEVADHYKGSTVAGELLAYVGRDSLDQGFDGFVLFEAKTKLLRYYQVKYGARWVKGRTLFFDTAATLKLISDYLPESAEQYGSPYADKQGGPAVGSASTNGDAPEGGQTT